MTERKVINTGTNPNDFTGDSIRTAFGKVNSNFEAVWDEKADAVARLSQSVNSVTLSAADSGGEYSNLDAMHILEATLPAAAAGLTFTFYTMAETGWKIVATNGATIRVGGNVSNIEGYIDNYTVGSAVTLTAVSDNKWIAHPVTGVWIPC